jgi:hypothetical protein
MSLTSHKRISPPELVYSYEQRQQSSTLSELLKCDVKLNLHIQPFIDASVIVFAHKHSATLRSAHFIAHHITCVVICTISVSSQHFCRPINRGIDLPAMVYSPTNRTLRSIFVFEVECFKPVINPYRCDDSFYKPSCVANSLCSLSFRLFCPMYPTEIDTHCNPFEVLLQLNGCDCYWCIKVSLFAFSRLHHFRNAFPFGTAYSFFEYYSSKYSSTGRTS